MAWIIRKKIWLVFCLDAKKISQRTTLSHGLSDKEKKNASDDFELHIELRNGETFQSYL